MIDSLQVRLLSENRCVVDAIINFDDLQTREPALFSRSERKQFSGSKSVRAEFHFSLSSGYLTFEAKPLESQVTPPHSLLMKMIQLIAASQPERIDTTRKIPGVIWIAEALDHGRSAVRRHLIQGRSCNGMGARIVEPFQRPAPAAEPFHPDRLRRVALRYSCGGRQFLIQGEPGEAIRHAGTRPERRSLA
jgi:hypothetical protein